jgi:hypothetical protein
MRLRRCPIGIAGAGIGAGAFDWDKSAALADAVASARIAVSARNRFFIGGPRPQICHQTRRESRTDLSMS